MGGQNDLPQGTRLLIMLWERGNHIGANETGGFEYTTCQLQQHHELYYPMRTACQHVECTQGHHEHHLAIDA